MESRILIVAVAGPSRRAARGGGEGGGGGRGDAQRKRKDRISYLRYETTSGERVVRARARESEEEENEGGGAVQRPTVRW